MGQLIPQPILTLFGGVSRQPVNVRRDNQYEEAINVLPSIVSGGIEKRPALQYLKRLQTLENRVQHSQLFTDAAWTKTSLTATKMTPSNYSHPKTPDYFSLDATSNGAFGVLSQTITVPNSGEYIFSIDLCAGDLEHGAIELEWADASKAVVLFDLGTGAISSTSGDRYVYSEIVDIDSIWYRISVRADNITTQTSLTAKVLVGETTAEQGIIYASRAQVEKVEYIDQVGATPYAYTTALTYVRKPVPGTNDEEYFLHKIDRDHTEQYFLLLSDGHIHVYDTITGEAKQVIIKDSTRYLAIDLFLDEPGFQRTYIEQAADETEIDYTIKWREAAGTIVVKIFHSDDGEAWTEMHSESISTATGSATTTETTGTAEWVKVEVTSAGTAGTVSVFGKYRDVRFLSEGAPSPSQFSAVSIADYTFCANNNITVQLGETGHPDGHTTKLGTYQNFSKLPAAASGNLNSLAYIQGDDVDAFEGYWVVCKLDDTRYYWMETVSPDEQNKFDPSTMPWQLVRTAEGWFEFSTSEWTERKSGDEASNPAPTFVGEQINYISFWRGRFVVLAGEAVVLSDAVDNTSFFAEKAVDVLDTDPIDRAAGTNKISKLLACLPFRKVLFITSSTMQFEVSAIEKLTSETAVLDVTTQYASSEFCLPTLMGDTLYFAAVRPGGNTVYEYYYDEDTLNNTGVDISKHIGNYIEGTILQMESDPVTGTLFVLSSGYSNGLYLYRTFWDAGDKVMSSWVKYSFGDEADTFIHGIGVFSGYLVGIIETPTGIYLTQMTVDTEANHAGFEYAPLLDFRCKIQGIYDSGNDTTKWIIPWSPTAKTRVLLATGDKGRILTTTIDGDYLVALGDHSAAPAYVGETYEYTVELSPLFPRNREGATIAEGTYKVKDITFSYADTGYFKVEVTPQHRETYTYEFTGYKVDDERALIDEQSVLSGKFTVPIVSEGKTAKIVIKNDTPLPCVITSAVVRGFFSEISRS